MAEAAKRQSIQGKAPVATPNVGPHGLVSLDGALNASIGARIRIQTANPATSTLEGILYTVCPITSLLALSTLPPKPVYHVVPLSSLTNFVILSPPTSGSLAPLAPLKTALLQARANTALERAKEKASRVNRDVSKEAQEIFDALYKQFPGTRWAGKDMVVLDAVLIKGPGYRTEDCGANGKEGAGALGRVKKVLENERRRITNRDTKPVKPVIPAIPAIPAFSGRERKGG